MSLRNSTKHPVKPDSAESEDSELVTRVKDLESSVHYTFKGPIPDPNTLKKYEQTHPGAIEWILNASDEERRHRHKIEEFVTKSYFMDIRRGQQFAFGTVIFIVGPSKRGCLHAPLLTDPCERN